jgi:hypothetical protein
MPILGNNPKVNGLEEEDDKPTSNLYICALFFSGSSMQYSNGSTKAKGNFGLVDFAQTKSMEQ